MWLKQSTAVTIKLGPFVDDTDGKTAETGLSIAQADIRLSKNGGDFAQTNDATGATHDESGYYDVPLNTTDTNTLGRLKVSVSKSGALPVWENFTVLPAVVYDALVAGSDYLQVDVLQFAGTNATAASGRPEVNTTHLAGTSQTARDIGASVLLSSGTGTGQLDFTSGVVKANTTQFNGNAVTAASGVPEVKVQSIATDAVNAAALAADAVSEILTALGTAGSIDDQLAAIVADTNELQSDWADDGRLDLILDIAAENSVSIVSQLSSIGSAINDINNATQPLVDVLEDNAGTYRFTAAALALTNLSASERSAIADALLNRNIDQTGNGTRTVEEALAVLRNKTAIVGTTLTVYDADDTTSLWTATIASSSSADPITGVDPA